MVMKEKAIEFLESLGVDEAVNFLQTTSASLPPEEQLRDFDQVMRHAYWQNKDLPATIRIGQAGVELGQSLADAHPDQASEIKSQIKTIQYNLASFTWPGWDEPGFDISPEQVQLGLAAAQENLRLAIELKKDALPLSRAYWMLGGVEIAVKDYASAKEHFSQAEKFASQAGSHAEALLARGFEFLTGLLVNPDNEILSKELEQTKTALLVEKDGEFFVKQIDDAWRVFGS
jgi:tetratricopeptide (TPR) repeat protein